MLFIMNWRLKLVLLFTRIRKPIDGEGADIKDVRTKSEKAAWLGTQLFDKAVNVSKVTNANADGVPVRIYQNSSATGQRVIIYYHGGGFVLYGLDSHDNVCRRLCAMNNCVVVSVDYRLAPEHTFPAAHEDAFTAIQWVIKNINNYGGNPNDLVVAGDSAGGNLSACMAHRCRRQNIKLAAQVLIYPWIDGKLNNPSIDRNGAGYLLTKESVFWFQKQYTPREEDRCVPAISPCYESDFTGLAPTFILTASLDPLLDDGYKYYNQLQAAGNTIRYQEYPGLVHGFICIPLVDRQAMQAYHDIRDFLSTVKA
jgi:acetyl esterase